MLKFILALHKISFLKKNWLTAISLVIPALRIVGFARVFRVVKGLRSIRLVKVVASVNRGMKSLGATRKRRGWKYVVAITLIVILGGAAGMYGFEKEQGLKSYCEALWWTTMIITSLGSDYWQQRREGKALCLLLAIYGFSVFGYITATLASFFVGRDAEEPDAPEAGFREIQKLQTKIDELTRLVREMAGKVQ